LELFVKRRNKLFYIQIKDLFVVDASITGLEFKKWRLLR